MEEKASLVRVVQRLVTDDELRRRLLIAPREALIAELGISGETYDALMTFVPVLLAGGLILLGGIDPGSQTIDAPGWGNWGK